MTPTAFLTAFAEAIANDGALVLLILVILWMGSRKTWVWGWSMERVERQLMDERLACIEEVRQLRDERDGWRRIALYQSGHPHPEGHVGPPENVGDDD